MLPRRGTRRHGQGGRGGGCNQPTERVVKNGGQTSAHPSLWCTCHLCWSCCFDDTVRRGFRTIMT